MSTDGSVDGITDASTMQTFLCITLENLIKLSSKTSELRKACQTVLEELSSSAKTSTDFNADRYFLPLRLACESEIPAAQRLSLDCIQKLIAYGYLKGTIIINEEGTSLLDVVVSTICKCNQSSDASVLLQVVKALLTLCSSSLLRGQTLIHAIWTLLSIHASSVDKVITNTSKGALSQVIGLVYTSALSQDSLSRLTNDDVAPAQLESFNTISPADGLVIFTKFVEMMRRAAKRVDPNTENYELQSFTLADNRIRYLILDFIATILDSFGSQILLFPQFKEVAKKNVSQLLVTLAATFGHVSTDSTVITYCSKISRLYLDLFFPTCRDECVLVFDSVVLTSLRSNSLSDSSKSIILNHIIDPLMNHVSFPALLFMNFDCELNSSNVWSELVQLLSKLSTSQDNLDLSSQNNHLSRDAIKCICTITTSLYKWYFKKELTDTWGVNQNDLENSLERLNLEKSRAAKSMLEKAFNLLQKKPEKCLDFLKENDDSFKNLSEDQEVTRFAQWLHSNTMIDKHVLGDFLGDSNHFSKKVVREYFRLVDFSRLDFVTAMRTWLVLFELPKESQQIDRIVECFAQSFCQSKSGEFSNPDSIYALAFATLMLNTDLHNFKVERKMTVDFFIANYRGVAPDDCNLTEEFLTSVYEEIKNKEIKRQVIRESGQQDSSGLSRDRVGIILPSFGDFAMELVTACCEPFVTVFIVNFKAIMSSNQIFKTFLDSFELFLTLLCSVSHSSVTQVVLFLLSESSLFTRHQLNIKSLSAFQMLLNCLPLYSTWLDFNAFVLLLASTSELQRLLTFPSSLPTFPKRTDQRLIKLSTIDHKNSQLLKSRFTTIDVDNVYSSTAQFDDRCVVAFLESLVFVSELEISGSLAVLSRARDMSSLFELIESIRSNSTFSIKLEDFERLSSSFWSLQKIPEVTYYNADRVRHTFNHLWKILSSFLLSVSSLSPSTSSQNPALVGVNSLRQLALKFLEREENNAFKFQKDFLKPFELIISQSDESISLIAISVLGEIAVKRAELLKSGWKSIFKAFSIVGKRHQKSNLTGAVLEQLSLLINTSSVYKHVITSFADVLSCISTIILSSTQSEESLSVCLRLLTKLSGTLVSGDIPEQQDDTCHEVAMFWPFLADAICGALASYNLNPNGRSILLAGLFNIILENISRMTIISRDHVFKGSLTMLLASLTAVHADELEETSQKAQSILIDLELILSTLSSVSLEHWDAVKSIFSVVLAVYRSPLTDGRLAVATLAFQSLKSFLTGIVDRLDADLWTTVVVIIQNFLEETLPINFVDKPIDSPSLGQSKRDYDRQSDVISIHYNLLELSHFFSKCSSFYTTTNDSIFRLFSSVTRSAELALSLNQNLQRRLVLRNSKFPCNPHLPSLLSHELLAYKILFQIFKNSLHLKLNVHENVSIKNFSSLLSKILFCSNIVYDSSNLEQSVIHVIQAQSLSDYEAQLKVQGEYLTEILEFSDELLFELFVLIYPIIIKMVTKSQPPEISRLVYRFLSEIVPKFLKCDVDIN
ncbi:hypothetical protein RCL1_001170 [Eukaryota sp. TZLM3-RCL]